MKTIRLNLLLLSVLLTISTLTLAQNPWWTLPNKQFRIGNMPVALPTNSGTTSYQGQVPIFDNNLGIPQDGPHNMYPDSAGNPLFFVYGGYMFNKGGYLIDTLIDTISVNHFSTRYVQRVVAQGLSDVCIVPDPTDCKKFFVFTTLSYVGGIEPFYYRPNTCTYLENGNGNSYEYSLPYYTKVDVGQPTPNAPTGQLGLNLKPNATVGTIAQLYKATNTQPPSGVTCGAYSGDIHYAATKVINKNGATPYRLLFLINSDEIITYKITSTVTWLYTYSISGLTSAGAGAYATFGDLTELEVYQDYANNKIKVAYGAPGSGAFAGNNKLVLMDFDTTGAFLSGSTPHVICTHGWCAGGSGGGYIQGVEFSPNGNYVYFTHTKDNSFTNTVERVDYSTGGNRISISNDTAFQHSQIETGTDGNLYLFKYGASNQPTLYKITNPNNAIPSISSAGVTMSNYPEPIAGDAAMWVYPAHTYYLPDQIDQDNYNSLYNASTSCCYFYSKFDRYIYSTASPESGWTASNQVWRPNTTAGSYQYNPLTTTTSSTVTIGQELRIAAGNTVTIQNMTLKFTPQATFVVEGKVGSYNPAKLILKKCTLTVDTRCSSALWPGVRVWGDNTAVRDSLHQGYIIVDSLSMITNAWIGVELGYDGSVDPNYTAVYPSPSNPTSANGGLIKAMNSTFQNNQRDIRFNTYTSNTGGLCSISNCTFNTTAYLLGGGATVKPLYHVELQTYKPTALIKGCAFSCTSTLNTYTGYAYGAYGIYSINSSCNVDKQGTTPSTFNNFLYGIYATGGTNFITVWNSTFTDNKVGTYMGLMTNGEFGTNTVAIYNYANVNASGLYLDNSTGYKVQGNYFTKGGGTISNHTYGIVVYNSGSYVNCIYSNTFNNLWKGSQAQYRNYVSAGVPSPQNWVGLVYLCNTFSSGSISNADIYVPARGSALNVGANYTGTDTAGIQHDQGTGATRYPQVGGNLFSHTTGGHDFYIEPTAGYALGVNYLYYCASPPCTGAANYPYVGVSSYVTVAPYTVQDIDCSTDPYRNGLRTVNPYQAMIDGAEENKNEYDSLALLLHGTQDSSDQRNIIIQMGNAFSTRHRMLDEAIHYLVNNPSDSSEALIKSFMREKALELPAKSQLETALQIEDSSWAATQLSSIANREGQSPYVKVFTVLVNNIGKTYQQIMQNPANVTLMQSLNQDSTDKRAYLVANMLLNSVGLSNYVPYYQENDASDSTGMKKAHQDLTKLRSTNSLGSQPNPFKDNATITANVSDFSSEAYVLVTDILGSVIKRYSVVKGENKMIFEATDASQTVYFCTLVIDGVKVQTNKMVLIK